MRRPRRLLPLLGALFLAAGAMQVWGAADLGARVLGAGVPAGDGDLLAGCRDVPEAVALAETLELRAARMVAYQATLDRSRAEIATAQSTLTSTLRQLKAVRDAVGSVLVASVSSAVTAACRCCSSLELMAIWRKM